MSTTVPPSGVPVRPGLLRDREFLTLVGSDAISNIGDQLARVALAVLVFARSHSPLLTAATLAASYLPWAVAAPFLAGLGDRYERRTVLVVSDLYRCVVAAVLALPGIPTALVIGLVFLLTCADPPFSSARSALLPDVLGDHRYAAGQAVTLTTNYISSFLGFAVGGLIVGALGAQNSMLVDSLSFAASAALLRFLLAQRGAPTVGEPDDAGGRPRGGWSLVFTNPGARWSLGMGALLIAINAVPFGIVVPWAAQLGYGPALAGMLVAASVIGAAVGQAYALQVSEETRSRLVIPLALASTAVLIVFLAVRTPLASALVLFASGVLSSYQGTVNQIFVLAMPPAARARAFGVAGTSINLGQGFAILIGGAIADSVMPSTVVAAVGVVGVVAVVALAPFRPGEARLRRPVEPDPTAPIG